MARRGGTRPLPRLSCLRVSSRCRRDLELSWGLSVGPSEGGRARGRARRRRWGEAERAAAGRGGSAPAELLRCLPIASYQKREVKSV